MIDRKTYNLDYIRELQRRYKTDPVLLERVLYAFGLLEALVKVGLKFTFKGGTSLMLILDHPVRLSTDIDIIVDPGTDVDRYIEQAGAIFPFGRLQTPLTMNMMSIYMICHQILPGIDGTERCLGRNSIPSVSGHPKASLLRISTIE